MECYEVYLEKSPEGVIGVELDGWNITYVVPNSPAFLSGVRPGMRVVEVCGNPVTPASAGPELDRAPQWGDFPIVVQCTTARKKTAYTPLKRTRKHRHQSTPPTAAREWWRTPLAHSEFPPCAFYTSPREKQKMRDAVERMDSVSCPRGPTAPLKELPPPPHGWPTHFSA
eukprot:Sspe_Gene.115174::Locus_102142_Transcript_1_1_Confidence_1.000_Length_722::g.115174::m.115174